MFGLIIAVFLSPTPSVLDCVVDNKGNVRENSRFVDSGAKLLVRFRGRIVAMFIQKGMTSDQVERMIGSTLYGGYYLSSGLIGSCRFYPEYGFFVWFELRNEKLRVTNVQFPH